MAKRRRRNPLTPGERGEQREYEWEKAVAKVTKILKAPMKKAVKFMDGIGVPPKHQWRVVQRAIDDNW